MTQSKHTKKALLASGMSLLACVVLLIGSTFAWFTDNVTSGRNQPCLIMRLCGSRVTPKWFT